MDRIIKFFLVILVLIAFFFGVRVGKKIQTIDTPIKTVNKLKKILITPKITMKKKIITNCLYTFITPDYLSIKLASDSAEISQGKQKLLIECLNNKKSQTGTVYLNSRTGKQVYISGSKILLKEINAGLDKDFSTNKDVIQ